jgi:hypothetical protein
MFIVRLVEISEAPGAPKTTGCDTSDEMRIDHLGFLLSPSHGLFLCWWWLTRESMVPIIWLGSQERLTPGCNSYRNLRPLGGDDEGRRLKRILASGGMVEARNAQTCPFSLFSAFFCGYRPSRCRQRWVPIRTPIIVFAVLEPQCFAFLSQFLPSLAPTTPV